MYVDTPPINNYDIETDEKKEEYEDFMMNYFSNVNEQKSFANSPLICCFQLLNGPCISYCFKKKESM